MTLSLMRDLRACFGAAVRPWFAITVYLLMASPALLTAYFGTDRTTASMSLLWAFGSFMLSTGLGFGALSLAAEARKLRLPSRRSLFPYALAVIVGVMLAGAVFPTLIVYLLSGAWRPALYFFGATTLGLLIVVMVARTWLIVFVAGCIAGVLGYVISQLGYVDAGHMAQIAGYVFAAAVLLVHGSQRWYQLLCGEFAATHRYRTHALSMSSSLKEVSEQDLYRSRSDTYFVSATSAAYTGSAVHRIRTLLGEPYAPMRLRRRLRRAGLVLLILGATALILILLPGVLSARRDGLTLYLYIAMVPPLCGILEYHRRLPIVLKRRGGVLTELSLLPTLGNAREQLHGYCVASLVPFALSNLFWLSLTLIFASLLPAAAVPVWTVLAIVSTLYVTVLLENIVSTLRILQEQEQEQERERGASFRSFITLFVGITCANVMSQPISMKSALYLGGMAAAVWLLFAATGWRAYRQLATRPHPFVEVTA